MLTRLERYRPWIVFLFFALFFVLGIFIFRDYGVHVDDINSRAFGGEKATDYLRRFAEKGFSAPYELFQYEFTHGVIFEVIMVNAPQWLGLQDARDVLFVRHFLVFIVFYGGVFFFYLLCRYYFKSWKLGLLGALFFILHPRIFSHAFYNSVDIPVLAFYVLGTYTLMRFLDQRDRSSATLHAFASALAMSVRLTGVMIPLATLFFAGVILFHVRKDPKTVKRMIELTVWYFLLLTLLVVILYPAAWKDPLDYFLRALNAQKWDQSYSEGHVPFQPSSWDFVPRWILITTPFAYSLFFLIGVLMTAVCFAMPRLQNYFRRRNAAVIALTFFAPLIMAALLHPRFANDWRHFFFVYAGFTMYGMAGIAAIWRGIKKFSRGFVSKILMALFAAILGFVLGDTVFFIVRHHPFQHIYCNALADKLIPSYAFLDYWGLSAGRALEAIARDDSGEQIKIYPAHLGQYFVDALPAKDRKRLLFVRDPHEAKYALLFYGAPIKMSGGIRYYVFREPNGTTAEIPIQAVIYQLNFMNKMILNVVRLQ